MFSKDLPKEWTRELKNALESESFSNLQAFLNQQKQQGKKIYPPRDHIFEAFQPVDFSKVKVVILGQDPYSNEGQAVGLSFAVPNSFFPKPPSLKNIFKELQTDLGISLSGNESDLRGWAQQGVLLLNTILTVEAKHPLSHQGKGWEQFTEDAILALNRRKVPVVFILWGSHAQKIKSQIDLSRHAIVESAHPSPLSAYRGFFGSRVFSRTNQILKKWGQSPVQWDKIEA